MAKSILGDPNYQAICYGGYRSTSRDIQPSVEQIIEDLMILSRMGIKIIRTYNVHYPEAQNILKAIKILTEQIQNFEMFVMLGVWIDCKNAWTEMEPIHNQESDRNAIEVDTAIALAKQYPQFIKIISIGNEAMVKWATKYYVHPKIVLKWVNHFQRLKIEGVISKDIYITSSDNFESWGGGSAEYHTPELIELISAVDYISIHLYPMHDTHYNPIFWGIKSADKLLDKNIQLIKLMKEALEYAKNQYYSVCEFINRIGVKKEVHIGETGWASYSNELYGNQGSKAADEYKAGLYYRMVREWTDSHNITCFYFEAFDEPWKDSSNEGGSENHFGLFTVSGAAKYAIWNYVKEGIFSGLFRDNNKIKMTNNGNLELLKEQCAIPYSMDINN